LLRGIGREADELAERLELGDNESVRAWFRHRYPKAMSKIVEEERWAEFISLVREIYQADRDG
jgi:hypothetical protein